MPCCDTVPLNLPLQQTCRITACKKVALVIERRFGSQALRKQSVAVAVITIARQSEQQHGIPSFC